MECFKSLQECVITLYQNAKIESSQFRNSLKILKNINNDDFSIPITQTLQITSYGMLQQMYDIIITYLYQSVEYVLMKAVARISILRIVGEIGVVSIVTHTYCIQIEIEEEIVDII